MDKSLQQQLYSGASRSPFGSSSSASSRTTVSRKSMHGNASIALGTAAAFKKTSAISGQSSRFSVSARSMQSVLGIRSEYHVVENFGFQLPVMVNEALTFNEKNQKVSVSCSQNSWAWLVHGRRLLIWQYNDTRKATNRSGTSPLRNSSKDLVRTPQRRGGAMAQCRELTLPHCDIGHKASLVSVFLGDGQQMASCVAVSPTGDVRYWPSIAHDGSSVDVTGILDGQEFDKLLEVPQQQGYLLVTTTCSLVFLQLQLVNGRHVLQHKTMRQPSGFLGSFGKKFASIIIGVNSGSDKENKFVGIGCEESSNGDAIATVLAEHWIQRWRIANNGATEQLVYEDGDIIRRIRMEFQQKFWNIRAENVDLELHLLDMQLAEDKIYVLAGAVNAMHTPQMYYAIAVLVPGSDAVRLHSFIPLKLTQFYNSGTKRECLKLRFIICRTHLYLYMDKVIYTLNLNNASSAEIEAEKIELQIQDDCILSASVCGQIPLFFSRTHGMICVTPGDFDSADYVNFSSPSPDVQLSDSLMREQSMAVAGIGSESLHMFDLDPDAMFNEFKDEVSQLKAAFVYHIKRNTSMCNSILNDLLRSTSDVALVGTNQLDKIVITIAEDLAEDIPAADPRWEQHLSESKGGNRHALGSSASLQILTQLREKNLALRHFIEFLHSTGIWDKLNALPAAGTGNTLKSTCLIISDINEKIIGAIALRGIQNKYGKLVDEAINRVVESWQKQAHGNLTAQDLFYVRVCRFQDIFQAFGDLIDARIESQQQGTSLAALISDINTIVLHVISEVMNFRDQNAVVYALPADKVDHFEFLPWTAMSGSVGIRDALSHLENVSVSYGARCAIEIELKQKLYQQVLEIIDIILDGRKNYVESVHDAEKSKVVVQQYESQRRNLISVLIEDGQLELAAKLAEKYLDFTSLVIICDETNNQERLDSYIKKYEEYDFSQFAINWHLRQNRQGELFERFKGNQAALSQFMRDHPTLGWIQLVFNGDFERAAKILYQLAQNETEFVERKKCMLSLAKLTVFASPDSDLTQQVENINNELSIIDYQEQISEHLLDAFGYDIENKKVLKIEEIINLFIAEENETATEFDFRKALELLTYMDEPYDVRHRIWCAAILRDNWTKYDTNRAVDYLQNLLFFKLIELCQLMDGDFDAYLPPMEEFLDSPDLGELIQDKSFQYLLKLNYEYIFDSYKKTDEDAMEI